MSTLDARLRLSASVHPGAFRGEAAWELVPLFRPKLPVQPSLLLRPMPSSYRAYDFNREVFTDDDEFFLFHNLDRLFISLSPSFAELHIGRQALSFGVSRAVLPTDIITFFTFDTLDQEHRIGVDAARGLIPLGELSELELGYIAGDKFCWQQSALYGRARTNLEGSDFEVLLMHFRENTLLGASLESSVADAGIWLEAAYTWARSFELFVEAKNYFRLSVGADYNFAEGVYLFGEYHYSSAGELERALVPANLMQVAYSQGGVYLLGRHYFVPGLSWEITPLTVLRSQLLCNLSDISAYLSASLEHSLSEDLYIELGGFISINRGQGSEFGYYPDIVYAALRRYF